MSKERDRSDCKLYENYETTKPRVTILSKVPYSQDIDMQIVARIQITEQLLILALQASTLEGSEILSDLREIWPNIRAAQCIRKKTP